MRRVDLNRLCIYLPIILFNQHQIKSDQTKVEAEDEGAANQEEVAEEQQNAKGAKARGIGRGKCTKVGNAGTELSRANSKVLGRPTKSKTGYKWCPACNQMLPLDKWKTGAGRCIDDRPFVQAIAYAAEPVGLVVQGFERSQKAADNCEVL